MSCLIRAATTSEIASIASVLVDTWRGTFHRLPSDDFLNEMSEARQEERYRKLIASPKCVCFVALDHNEDVVGFVSGGPTRSPLLSVPNEVYALYVKQNKQRMGIGKALFHQASAALSASVGGLCVWVLEINPCRLFYEHLGGEEVAREEILLGADRVCQVAYTWAM